MCEICHHHICPSNCPNADEPAVITKCILCGAKIREGEDYYLIEDDPFCEECIRKCRKIAGEE